MYIAVGKSSQSMVTRVLQKYRIPKIVLSQNRKVCSTHFFRISRSLRGNLITEPEKIGTRSISRIISLQAYLNFNNRRSPLFRRVQTGKATSSYQCNLSGTELYHASVVDS